MIIGLGIEADSGKPSDRGTLEQVGCERVIIVGSALEAKFKIDEILQYVRAGDTLCVAHLDRLGDTLDRIVRTVERLHQLKVGLHVDGSIVPGTPMGDSFVDVCHHLAQQCPAPNHPRSAAPNDASQTNRSRGRPGSLTSIEQDRAMRMLSEGRATVPEVARLFKVSTATIYRLFPRRRAGAAAPDGIAPPPR